MWSGTPFVLFLLPGRRFWLPSSYVLEEIKLSYTRKPYGRKQPLSARHDFAVNIEWQHGPHEKPHKRTFPRNHTVRLSESIALEGSSAQQFHGDSSRWNPEQLFLASLGQCHMLTFLFLASQQNLTVLTYSSEISGTITMDPDGIGGEFTKIVISPTIALTGDDESNSEAVRIARATLSKVDDHCFIARSVQVPIDVVPHFIIGNGQNSSH